MILVTCFDEAYQARAERMIKSVTVHNENVHAIRFFYPRKAFETAEHCIDFVANRRAWIIKQALKHMREREELIYLDPDSICRREIVFPDADVSTLAVPQAADEFNKYLISSMFFRNTGPAREFVYKWVEILEQIRKGTLSIMTVQLAFKRTMDVLGNQINFKCCSENLCDSDLRGDTAIWCGRGMRKNSERYKTEEKLYDA